MKDNSGYIKVTAVIQKFLDQAISGNWSYNPQNYPNGEVPMSVMTRDLIETYKYGWKTSYYQNTYDAKTDVDEPSHPVGWHDNVEETKVSTLESLVNSIETSNESECESCTI